MSHSSPFLAGLPPEFRHFTPGAELDNDRMSLRWRDLSIRSVFQPIVSFSHSRVVGHEGLVRIAGNSATTISPPDFFRLVDATGELPQVDRACRLMHAWNARSAGGWLFLNLHPALFGRFDADDSARMVAAMVAGTGVPAHRCIIEVVEEAVIDRVRLEEGTAALRALGLGLALDDFGAGHSNFDRVWRIQPDVVKLDRSFAVRTEHDAAARRVLPRLVSMLHETGALVLLEGIETLDQALIAMDSDIDFGQGWFFARPAPDVLQDSQPVAPALDALWSRYEEHIHAQETQHHQRIAPYLNAIGYAGVLLSSGVPLQNAAGGFLSQPAAECFYLLDAEGRQVGTNISAREQRGQGVLRELGVMPGARWSRRPYFRRALQHPGKPQVTRPYVSISSGNTCVTVSAHVRINGHEHVICGDVDWDLLLQGESAPSVCRR
ncbi:EAL domain-containing protein [Uliginosibacterium sp. H3]|uniref:EAL domain-containing protein n=1 Tax=Uliginosibacterium silvisoli TaxID=3114758 RepID=A0ABU6K2F2_9RHOO|nr:EAL domain-containing protein [Uliginosibacterium sp. H3]